MDFPIHLGDPFYLHIECVYALASLVLGLFYIYHLDLPTLPYLIVTPLFLMDWFQTHFSEDE